MHQPGVKNFTNKKKYKTSGCLQKMTKETLEKPLISLEEHPGRISKAIPGEVSEGIHKNHRERILGETSEAIS